MARVFSWHEETSFEWDFRPAPRQRGGAAAVAFPTPRAGRMRLAPSVAPVSASQPRAGFPMRALVLAALTLAVVVAGLAIRTQLSRETTVPARTEEPAAPAIVRPARTSFGTRAPRVAAAAVRPAARAAPLPRIVWHQSRSIGLPWSGHLVNGVRLPAEGRTFFTWDPILDRTPNRTWRRYGSARLIQTVLGVIAAYHRAHPKAPRIGIADLSRPRGGVFGRRFGGLGHVSHQNGLDVDVLYPRRDGREASPGRPSQIDRALAQDLLNRFVAAGAQFVFVGPSTHLRGPAPIVQVLAHHDDHMHVRILPGQ